MHLLTEFTAPHGWIALILCMIGTSLASYFWAGRGFVLSVILVGVAYAILDQRWIRAEMDAPGWDGTPDQDAIFYLGVAIRLVFMSVILFATFVTTLFVTSRFGNGKSL
ncbi:hypothetical protein Pla22_52270 [Rubripirellula amarantea]|uniref:Transmembrane protein n=1 Tax=Rubripirellula amarantea TaxID=2527999 RepID=A0A5C5WB08_9BACT|nr:hypothetical protein [Rubripirellula amarantea]TWT47860.1 hypothetical protein Pla22_52270 [Rubripirellula amarantea]